MQTPETEEVGSAEAARILGVNPFTLTSWRKKGTGPPWRQEEIPGRVSSRTNPIRYRVSDLEAYQRGDVHREDPHQPERFHETRPQDLEALSVGTEATAELGGRIVSLTKAKATGMTWLDHETNESITTFRAAQLGFQVAQGEAV